MGLTLRDLLEYIQHLARQNATIAKKNCNGFDDERKTTNQQSKKEAFLKNNNTLLNKTAELGKMHNLIFQFLIDNLQDIMTYVNEREHAKETGFERSVESKKIIKKDMRQEKNMQDIERSNEHLKQTKKEKEKVTITVKKKDKYGNTEKNIKIKLQSLNEKLKECIAKEEYEVCQEIYDQIKYLQTKTKGYE